jgi:hypothetical protein
VEWKERWWFFTTKDAQCPEGNVRFMLNNLETLIWFNGPNWYHGEIFGLTWKLVLSFKLIMARHFGVF